MGSGWSAAAVRPEQVQGRQGLRLGLCAVGSSREELQDAQVLGYFKGERGADWPAVAPQNCLRGLGAQIITCPWLRSF